MEFNIFAGGIIRAKRELTEPKTTQDMLKNYLGLRSSGAISQVERGEKSLTAEKFFRALHYLDIDPTWFWDEYKKHEFSDEYIV